MLKMLKMPVGFEKVFKELDWEIFLFTVFYMKILIAYSRWQTFRNKLAADTSIFEFLKQFQMRIRTPFNVVFFLLAERYWKVWKDST